MSTDFDWAHLINVIEPKRDTQCLAWEDVRSNFRKIAWDVYKPLDGSEQLWELRDGDDGRKYLYAMYQSAPEKPAESNIIEEIRTTASADWTATCDRDRKNITLSFKGFPLKRFASTEFKFEPDEAEQFAAFLQAKTAQPEFVRQVLKGLPLHMAEVVSELKTHSEE
jgi:hypothetical protein